MSICSKEIVTEKKLQVRVSDGTHGKTYSFIREDGSDIVSFFDGVYVASPEYRIGVGAMIKFAERLIELCS